MLRFWNKCLSINWLRFTRSLHRDIGYLIIGCTFVFAISGIALNHIRDFNINYEVETHVRKIPLDLNLSDSEISATLLGEYASKLTVKASYWESPSHYKLFLDGGHTLSYDAQSAMATMETLAARPVLPHLNRLHLNEGNPYWVIFSDLYAMCLLVLASTALFMVKGANAAFSKRKIGLVLAGIAIPLWFIFLT